MTTTIRHAQTRFVCVLVALAIFAAGCSWLSLPDLPDAGPVVVVTSGLTPRMTPDQVADRVLGLIQRKEELAGQVAKPPKILRMTATTMAQVPHVEANAGQVSPANHQIVWVVRAEGTFTTNRYPPGAKPPVATSGYYVISDSDGGVVQFGLP